MNQALALRKQSVAPREVCEVIPAQIRPFPYPYRAMLAISSDLDETPDSTRYFEIMRYLNSTARTAFGPGLALEVGNSIYFDMPPGQFSYWNTDAAGREMLRTLIRSGHIDCLHSFGDLATTRAHAARALDELDRHGCRLEVWVDHATAPTNFGADIMQGQGDVPGAAAYHADLSCAYGIRYVWRGRVTSVIGQDAPRSLAGLWRRDHPIASSRTLTKEWVKGWLARAGSPKYAMHAPNALLREAILRDGRSVVEFLRANPSWAGVSRHETAAGLAEVLSARMLDLLVARGAVCVLYTHLGKPANAPDRGFSARTRAALMRLAQRYHAGELLVATTRRVLGYCALRQRVRCQLAAPCASDAPWRLEISGPEVPSASLAGLTVYVPEPARTVPYFNGRPLEGVQCNPPDETGLASLSLPWHRLAFPLA